MKKMSVFFLLILLNVPRLFAADVLTPLLEKAKKENKFVMLELGVSGCIPCEKMKPVIDKLSKNYRDRLEIIFLDVKKHNNIAKKWGVYVVPVQVFLDRGGKEVYRHIGYYSYDEIVSVLKRLGI